MASFTPMRGLSRPLWRGTLRRRKSIRRMNSNRRCSALSPIAGQVPDQCGRRILEGLHANDLGPRTNCRRDHQTNLGSLGLNRPRTARSLPRGGCRVRPMSSGDASPSLTPNLSPYREVGAGPAAPPPSYIESVRDRSRCRCTRWCTGRRRLDRPAQPYRLQPCRR